MKKEEISDEELMQKFINGSEPAFNSLYERYAGRVYFYLNKRLKDKNLVDEVFQEAFYKFTRSRYKYNSKYKFSPWLFSIVHNALIDSVRKVNSNKCDLGIEVDNIIIQDNHESVVEPDIEQLFSSLSEREKEIIKLRYVNDLSFEKIAVRTGHLASNIRQIISRSIKKLKKEHL